MTFATAVPILFTSFVYSTNVYWSVIHGIKRKPHLSVVWNWYHLVAIAILHQPHPTDSADINTRLQLSDTSSIPPMHDGFLLIWLGWSWCYMFGLLISILQINMVVCFYPIRHRTAEYVWTMSQFPVSCIQSYQYTWEQKYKYNILLLKGSV